MIYFKKNNEYLEKYEVTYDKEKVEQLKERIIFECSRIEHRQYCSDYGSCIRDEKLVKNFKAVLVGKHEYWEETRNVYKYTYDEYVPSDLVKYIDELLNDYSSSIDKIFNYDFKNDKSIDGLINEAMIKFNNMDQEDVIDKQQHLKYLDNLLESKKINSTQKDIRPYYQELIPLIGFELVDKILISDIARVYLFLEQDQFELEKVNVRKK